MKRTNPFLDAMGPNKRRYQKLNIMTDEEIKDYPFTAHELVSLMSDGASAVQTLRILTFHPHLINESDDNGRTVLMEALHRGKEKLLQGLLEKNANPHQISNTKFKEYLTPVEFVERICDKMSIKKCSLLLKMLNDHKDRTFKENIVHCNINNEKLNKMTNEEIRDYPFTVHELVKLMGVGAAEIGVLRIITYHPHLINGVDDNGRTVLMNALHTESVQLVQWLLQKNANLYQKSTTKFNEKLTPIEFLQKMIDEPSTKSKNTYEKLLAILNRYKDKSFPSKVLNLVGEEQITRLTSTALAPLPKQLNNGFSEDSVNTPFELSPPVAFLPGYEMQNQVLESGRHDLFSDFNNEPVVKQSVTDYLLYGFDDLFINQSNLNYLMDNFSDLQKSRP